MTEQRPKDYEPRDVLGPLVGRGFNCEVHECNDGRVVKVFHPSVPTATIEHEFRISRAVHDAGLPAPEAFELAEICGRRGIVLERIEGRSLFDDVRAKPWKLFAAAKRMAEFHARIHEAKAPSGLPAWKVKIRGKLAANEALSASDRLAAAERLDALPDGEAVCHGDIHPANVLITANGLSAVDWGGATCGHPLGDVATTVRLLEQAELPSWSPRPMHWLLKWSRKTLLRTYLSRYFQIRGGTLERLAPWREFLNAFLPRINTEAVASTPAKSGGHFAGR